VYLLYGIVLVGALVLNLLNVSITSLLNAVSAYWHMAGVAVIVLILIVVPDEHRSLGFVFTDTINATGWGSENANFTNPVFWYVFATGLLMAQYTITGYDASAHMAEETRQASRGAAVGMYMSVVVSVVFGFILLLAVTFAIPAEIPVIDLYVVPTIWEAAMSRGWAEALLFICCVAQFFCLTASVTSASRMMFAFSRDGAVPGHRLWRQVGRNRVPHFAVIGICVLAAAIMAPAIWNFFIGYYVGTGIAVVGLYIAFILPVILRYRLGDRFQQGAWSLGRHYKWIDLVAIAWVALISVAFFGPPYRVSFWGQEGFSWEFVNYAPILVGGALLLFGGWWVLSANKWFKGPVRMGTEEELERIEERFERPAPGIAPAGK
jgi:amino acid transporter